MQIFGILNICGKLANATIDNDEETLGFVRCPLGVDQKFVSMYVCMSLVKRCTNTTDKRCGYVMYVCMNMCFHDQWERLVS